MAANISLKVHSMGPYERRVISGVGMHGPPRKSPLGQSGSAFASYLLRVPERPFPHGASVSPSVKWSWHGPHSQDYSSSVPVGI